MALTPFRATDFDPMLEAMGLAVSMGSGPTLIETHGLVTRPDEEALGGAGPPAALPRVAVRVRSGVLTALAPGATVTVAGTAYVVGEVRALGDGAHTEFTLMAKGA